MSRLEKLLTQLSPESRPLVAVLGGGAAGVRSAKELSNLGFNVVILEKNKSLLLGSSNATPGRPALGFHYVHEDTATFCLDTTLYLLREFPGYTLSAKPSAPDTMRHGLYFIMKQPEELYHQATDEKISSKEFETTLSSLTTREKDGLLSADEARKLFQLKQAKQFGCQFPLQKILATYEKLKKHYAQKITEDAGNKIFGEPEDFYRVRNLDDFKETDDISKVAMVIETQEALLDWEKIRERLLDSINRDKHITVHLHTEVTSVSYEEKTEEFIVTTQNPDKHTLKVRAVVNSTWEGIAHINTSMGFQSLTERTIRLKGIITVSLPQELSAMNSRFYCMGPFAMISVMGNGTAKCTYAPVTNIYSSTDTDVPEKMLLFLDDRIKPDEKIDLAKRILAGVCLFAPCMKKATILDLNVGIIQTYGGFSYADPDSPHNLRNYRGISIEMERWVSNALMKLILFPTNGIIVAQATGIMVAAHLMRRKTQHKLKPAEQLFLTSVAHEVEQLIRSQTSFDTITASLDQHVEKLATYPLVDTPASRLAYDGSAACDEKTIAFPQTPRRQPISALQQLAQIFTGCQLSSKTKIAMLFAFLFLGYFLYRQLSAGCDRVIPILDFWRTDLCSTQSDSSIIPTSSSFTL